MKNRSRLAAKVTGVLAAGALLFGVVGPAGAASQSVSYALTSGGISLPTSTVPLVIPLPAATGLTGTWDDATGAFSAAFTSVEFSSTRAITSPIAGDLTQRIQFTAPNPVTGNIDPATGLGTLAANFTVTIVVESLALATDPTNPITIDVICPMTNVAVTYDVVATGLGGTSVIPTDLALTAQAFTVPVPTCVLGPNGNAALLPSVQTGLVDALALPNSGGTSVLQMVAGAIPPPPSTTTTTIVTPTTAPTTTAPPPARPATPVAAAARFTG